MLPFARCRRARRPSTTPLALCVSLALAGCTDLPVAPTGPGADRPTLATLQTGSTFTLQPLGLAADVTTIFYWPLGINTRGQVLLYHQPTSGGATLVLWGNGVITPAIPPIPAGHFAAILTSCLANDGTIVYTLQSNALNQRAVHRVLPDGTPEVVIPMGSVVVVPWVQGCNAQGDILLRRGNVFHLYRGGTAQPISLVAGHLLEIPQLSLNEAGHVLHVYADVSTSPFPRFAYLDVGTGPQALSVIWPDHETVQAFTSEGALLFPSSVFEGGVHYPLPMPEGYEWVDATAINDHAQVIGHGERWSETQGRYVREILLWTHVPPTPSTQIGIMSASIDDLVATGALAHGPAAALMMKLNAADRLITKGSTTGAVGQINAFLHQTSALIKTGRLDPTAGQSLLDAASRLLSALG